MSNPKDKAIELVNKFSTVGLQQREEGIACAIMAVNEIINSAPFFCYDEEGNFYRSVIDAKIYWEQVKEEIQKL